MLRPLAINPINQLIFTLTLINNGSSLILFDLISFSRGIESVLLSTNHLSSGSGVASRSGSLVHICCILVLPTVEFMFNTSPFQLY